MNPNIEFELFTQRVYQKLVNNDVIKPTIVQHNVKLKGKSGCEHQIDVYWEYEIAGNMHRVAIECKNYNSPVPIGKVRDFWGVINDLENVRGIMVSNKGFQEGSKKYAQYYGISLKELREPGWNESIGSITTSIVTEMRHTLFLIDEDWIREHNFSLDGIRSFLAQFQFQKAEYWKKATHIPIEKNNDAIYNSNGIIIASTKCLGAMLLDKQDPGTIIIFKFDDAWIDSRYWGPVKIREVKFEYESNLHESVMEIAATDFVEAILEDALGGKTDYVPKY